MVEINLKKKKWLLCCSYNPHKNSISNYVDVLRRELDIHPSNYENFLLLGDFNAEIKKPTCFKNPDNPEAIDLLLTNRLGAFVILILLKQDFQISINYL